MKCELCDKPRLDSGDYPRLCLRHKRERKAKINQRQLRTPRGLLLRIYSCQKDRSNKRGWLPPNYSLGDLLRAYLNDRRFQRLHAEWVKSGFLAEKRPCIDRINCLKPYTIRNIQVLTLEENRYKARMESRQRLGKPVAAYKDGTLIREFASMAAAGRRFKLSIPNICRCVRGELKTCGGYGWEYA